MKLSMKNKEQLMIYHKQTQRCEIGDIAYLTDEDKYVMFNGTNWIEYEPEAPKEQKMEGLFFNLYDLNKTLIQQLPIPTEEEIEKFRNIINIYCDNIDSGYYMLLCKDISYYTLFLRTAAEPEFDDFGAAVLECVENVGQIISADLTDDKSAIEIWVKVDDEPYCMYFFDSHNMVVTCGG